MSVRINGSHHEAAFRNLFAHAIGTILVIAAVQAFLVEGQAHAGAVVQPSAKVQKILNQLERGPSREELRVLLTNAHLTSSEAQQLAAEMKKLDAAGGLDALKRRAKLDAKLPTATPTSRMIPDLNGLRITLRQEQTRKTEALNRVSSTAWGSAGSGVGAAGGITTQRAAQFPTPRPLVSTTVQSQRPRSNVVITYLNPNMPPVGEDVTITGSEFGAAPGRVSVAFRIGGPGGTSYNCVVRSWSANRIEVTVPTEIEQLYRNSSGFDNGAERAMVFVLPADGSLGAAKECDVRLSPSRFVPRINGTTPDQITPGSRVTMTGTNLKMFHEPVVTIALPGDSVSSHNLRVVRAERNVIEVEMDAELGGAVAGEATLKVSNYFSTTEGTARIRFTPAEELRELSQRASAECFSLLNQIFGIEGLCLWGEENRVAISHRVGHGFQLTGQRVVTSSSASGNSGCYFSSDLSQAPSGHISGEGVAWADAFSRVSCGFVAIVRGPRGVYP